jgi:molybdopterin converting factor subunit 1
MATVTVRLFARLADMAGSRSLDVDLGEGLCAGDMLALLAREHPGVAALGANVMYAVNQEYVPRDHPLRDGDELAIIPPVSGGADAV